MTGSWLVGTLETTVVWLTAYCVHSSILLAGAWLAGRLLGERRMEIQETIWRVALIGGVVTATLQMVSGLRPLGGEFRLVNLTPGKQVATAQATGGLDTPTGIASFSKGDAATAGTARTDETVLVAARTADGHRTASSAIGGWSVLFVLVWISGAIRAVIGVARSRVRLGRVLRTGRCMPPGRLIRRLARLMGVTRPVAVRLSPVFDAPFATGVFNPEICVPDSTISELTPSEVENLLAHEMAHLARHDPAWTVFCRLIEGVFFFQPLNRLTRRRLETVAECLCDDRAISCTGTPLDLARCLLQVAEKSTQGRPLLAVAAVASRSQLGHRIERLLRPAVGTTPCGPWVTATLAFGLLASAAVLPAISASAVDPSQPAATSGGFGGVSSRAYAPEPPDEPEPVALVGEVEGETPAAEHERPARHEPTVEPEALAAAERLEMLAQLEAEVAASREAQSADFERQMAENEAAFAAAAAEATRAIDRHLAALENQSLDLEQTKNAIRHEMQALQRRLRALDAQREMGREEIERHRDEARRQAEESRLDLRELERERVELRERQREVESQVREEQRLAYEQQRTEREAIRLSVSEAARRDAEQRRQAEFLARQEAELARQEKEQPKEQNRPD